MDYKSAFEGLARSASAFRQELIRMEEETIILQALGHKTGAVKAIYLDSFASDTIDSAFEHLLQKTLRPQAYAELPKRRATNHSFSAS